jgi:hypothetical protein
VSEPISQQAAHHTCWSLRCHSKDVSDIAKSSQKKAGSVLVLFLLATMTASAVSKSQSVPSARAFHKRPVRSAAVKRTASADYRRLALQKYFQNCGCPAARWTGVFIREADRNKLDWRLVASIAMIESTGGKHYKNRNILGWRSALQRFPSETAGIAYVSSRFHNYPLYKDNSLAQLLRTYNSERRDYSVLINKVMTQLDAIKGDLETRGSVLALNSETTPERKS